MLNLISAPRYPTTSGKKEESMVIIARTLIDSLPRVAHYRAVSKASSRSSTESSFEIESESEEEKVALLSTIPKSLKHASNTIRSSYGSIINTDKRSESRKVALKSSISRPIPHSHQCTFDKTQIQSQDEMDSRGSLYSNHSWSDKVEKLSVSPFEFDLDQQQNLDKQAGEKAIRRVSVESFASSERCYGFF